MAPAGTHVALSQSPQIVTIEGLQKSNGYTREGTLDNLIPYRKEDQAGARPYGGYMNGGMLLALTYREVVARCRTDDAKGAEQLLC